MRVKWNEHLKQPFAIGMLIVGLGVLLVWGALYLNFLGTAMLFRPSLSPFAFGLSMLLLGVVWLVSVAPEDVAGPDSWDTEGVSRWLGSPPRAVELPRSHYVRVFLGLCVVLFGVSTAYERVAQRTVDFREIMHARSAPGEVVAVKPPHQVQFRFTTRDGEVRSEWVGTHLPYAVGDRSEVLYRPKAAPYSRGGALDVYDGKVLAAVPLPRKGPRVPLSALLFALFGCALVLWPVVAARRERRAFEQGVVSAGSSGSPVLRMPNGKDVEIRPPRYIIYETRAVPEARTRS